MPLKKPPERPVYLSRNQYGALRYISTHTVSLDNLREYRDATLWSLLYRKYLQISIGGNVFLSTNGYKAFEDYKLAEIPYRKVERDITDRSQALLTVARLKAKKEKAA